MTCKNNILCSILEDKDLLEGEVLLSIEEEGQYNEKKSISFVVMGMFVISVVYISVTNKNVTLAFSQYIAIVERRFYYEKSFYNFL